MNITLTVVVAAIVILITALVVITIFGGGIGQVGSATSATAICQTQCDTSCKATNSPPITWNAPTAKDTNGNPASCQTIIGACTCPNQPANPIV